METKEVSFSAKDVMALRQKTGMGMMDCKKALSENNGDMDAAEQWLRERAKGKMDARTERATGEGRIAIAVDGSKAAIVEVLTETDFTAKNEDFVAMAEDVAKMALNQPAGDVQATDDIAKRIDDVRFTTKENVNFSRGKKLEGGSFGAYVHHDGKRAALVQVEGEVDPELLKGVCQHIVFHDPKGIDESDINAEELNTIRGDAIAEAKASGKNDEIAGKIAEGKVRKFLEENTLVNQKYIVDETKTVKQVLPPGTTIKQFVRYTLGA